MAKEVKVFFYFTKIIEPKKDEFKIYLDKIELVDSYSKILVALYEEKENRPNNFNE